MKAPKGCALKAVKAPKGKILCYELTQGDKVWREPTAAQAIEAREADIQRATEESDLPIMLVNPTDDPTEIALCGFRVLGAWRYGFVRKPTAHGLGLDSSATWRSPAGGSAWLTASRPCASESTRACRNAAFRRSRGGE